MALSADAQSASSGEWAIVARMSTKPNQALIYLKVPPYLQQMREKADLTQRQLAARTKLTQWQIARIETGSRRIDIAEFIEFCAGCGVKPTQALDELASYRR